MARTSVAVDTTIPDGLILTPRIDHFTQAGAGGTFDLGDATAIPFDAVEADIQTALDGAYTPGDYVVTGDADDFTVQYPLGHPASLDFDTTNLTGTPAPTTETTQTEPGDQLHASDGAKFVNNGRTRVLVRNGGVGSHTVTFVATKTVRGLAVPSKTFTLAAGLYAVFGPFETDTFNVRSGGDAGQVHVDANGTESEIQIVPFIDS